MASFTTLLDAVLTAGKPLTQAIVRAFRDNLTATAEGASDSPIFASKTGASLVLLDRQEANNTAAQILLTTGIDATLYALFLIQMHSLVLSANDDALSLQTSTDGGSSYDSGASDYRWGVSTHPDDGSADGAYGSTGDSRIKLWGTAGGGSSGMTNNSAAGGFSGNIWLFNRNVAVNRRVIWDASGSVVTSLADARITGSGRRVATTAVDAVRLYTESGSNIVSGLVSVFGIKANNTPGNWP
jgi:hypothetical protein